MAGSSPATSDPLLVVGTVRDVANVIGGDIRRVSQVLGANRPLQWLLVESDSSDGTLAALADLQRDLPNFDFLSAGRLQDRMPKRTQRIAHCRNLYADLIERDDRYRRFRYVAVADLDGINESLTPAALDSCWARSNWSVVTANQAENYYDIWALRHASWSPNDCWAAYRALVALGIPAASAKDAAVLSRMIHIPPTAPWIEVDSAFGGLGLYRREVFEGARYVGLDASGEEVCEHVPFHAAARARGHRIFINPAFVTGRAPATGWRKLASRARAELARRIGRAA